MRLFMVILLSLLAACNSNSQTTRELDMYNVSGDMVGTAVYTEQPEGVQIEIKVEGLTPGFHGVHIHEYAKCEGPDFKSAGNHLNPEGKEHGLMHPEGAHLGDLQNIEADSAGMVDVELTAADATLLSGKKSLLPKEGSSLIIDEDPDDGLSQPSGNSGTRIICGELKKDEEESSLETPTDPTETDIKNKEESE